MTLYSGLPPEETKAQRENRVRKAFRVQLEVGKAYRVEGYHTGDFLGLCNHVGQTLARFTVTDPLSCAADKGQDIEVVFNSHVKVISL